MARYLLEALVIIEGKAGVSTDVNPYNVFLSDVNGPKPAVQLGIWKIVSLGCRTEGENVGLKMIQVMSAGPMLKIRFQVRILFRVQSISQAANHVSTQGVVRRAPEVWIDLPITPKADVWSLGVKLAHWLAGRTIFGPADKIVEDCVNHWCIAKLMRLVGPIPQPEPSKVEIVDEFALAEYFMKESFIHPETGDEQKYITVGTIRQELEKVKGPIDPQCIGFIESLLTVDVDKRPSAREALKHPWLTGD